MTAIQSNSTITIKISSYPSRRNEMMKDDPFQNMWPKIAQKIPRGIVFGTGKFVFFPLSKILEKYEAGRFPSPAELVCNPELASKVIQFSTF